MLPALSQVASQELWWCVHTMLIPLSQCDLHTKALIPSVTPTAIMWHLQLPPRHQLLCCWVASRNSFFPLIMQIFSPILSLIWVNGNCLDTYANDSA